MLAWSIDSKFLHTLYGAFCRTMRTWTVSKISFSTSSSSSCITLSHTHLQWTAGLPVVLDPCYRRKTLSNPTTNLRPTHWPSNESNPSYQHLQSDLSASILEDSKSLTNQMKPLTRVCMALRCCRGGKPGDGNRAIFDLGFIILPTALTAYVVTKGDAHESKTVRLPKRC